MGWIFLEYIDKKSDVFRYHFDEDFISKYKDGNIFNHEETRERKLLLHKSEIKKISKQVELNGYTLVPLKIYFDYN